MKREGHKRPPPAFGAPTLIWHIGVWPKKEFAASDTKPDVEFDVEPDPHPTEGRLGHVKDHENRIYAKAHLENRNRREEFVESINIFLGKLQDGRRSAASVEQFHWMKYNSDKRSSFRVLDHDSVGFTLWWSGHGAVAAGVYPGEDAIRVRVQVESHLDHFTFSFYMDVSKLWLSNPDAEDRVFNLADQACKGETRRAIFQAVENLRSICDARISNSDVIDKDLLPEILLEAPGHKGQAETLRKSAKLLYKSVWEQFCKDLDFDRDDIAGGKGEIFAEFRGLVHAVRAGCERKPALNANLGSAPLPRFVNDKQDTSEANRVLKAYWPFVRRISPYADHREFIACGMMDWRALYITALGSQDEFDPRDESESRLTEVPKGHLIEPESYADYLKARQENALRKERGESITPSPIRYLFLTKCDPDRRQIGRIVARVFSLGTMRLFALKDLDVIREASLHIRMRGQHLDEVMKAWSRTREKISKFIEQQDEKGRFNRETGKQTIDARDTELNNLLTELTQFVEKDLIDINAHIEDLGDESVGGLPYAINRARYYIKSFMGTMETLRVGNIDGWVSYDSFVRRRLTPTFEFIDSTGQRLNSLRIRLQAVTESIQTSAVQIQTAATRRNTDTLRDIAQIWKNTNNLLKLLSVIGIALTVVQALWVFGLKDAAQFSICKYVISRHFPEDGPHLCPKEYFPAP